MVDKEAAIPTRAVVKAFRSTSFLDFIDSGLGLILSQSQENVDLVERLRQEIKYWTLKNSQIQSFKVKVRREHLCLEYHAGNCARAYKHMCQTEKVIQEAQLRLLERHTILIYKLNVAEEKFHLYQHKRINVEYTRREILKQRRRQLREEYVYLNTFPKPVCDDEESKSWEEGINKIYRRFLMVREKLRNIKHLGQIAKLETCNNRGKIAKSLISKRINTLAKAGTMLSDAEDKIRTVISDVIVNMSLVVSDPDSTEIQFHSLEQDTFNVRRLVSLRNQLQATLKAKRETYRANRRSIDETKEFIAKCKKDIVKVKSFNEGMKDEVLKAYRDLCEYQKIELEFISKTKDLEYENKEKRKEDAELQTKLMNLTEYVSTEQRANMEIRERLVLLRYKKALYEERRERQGRKQKKWSTIFKL